SINYVWDSVSVLRHVIGCDRTSLASINYVWDSVSVLRHVIGCDKYIRNHNNFLNVLVLLLH
ncbi:MAG: hypothetical protein ACLR1A_06030, partial [Eubacterium ventriosum]